MFVVLGASAPRALASRTPCCLSGSRVGPLIGVGFCSVTNFAWPASRHRRFQHFRMGLAMRASCPIAAISQVWAISRTIFGFRSDRAVLAQSMNSCAQLRNSFHPTRSLRG
jgi:hypothetical protein